MDDVALAGRLYDLAMAARPDIPDWGANLERNCTREQFLEVFPQLMEIVETPNVLGRAQQFLFDCYKDNLLIMISLAAELWRAQSESASERRRAEALHALLAWFDAGGIPPPRKPRLAS